MTDTPQSGWNRRDFVGAATLFALAVGMPASVAALSDLADEDAPSERQLALLREVSQLVLPATDTPGAGDAGVGDFVALALAHGLEGSRRRLGADADPAWSAFRRRDGSLDHVAWLEATLNRLASGNFLAAGPQGRAALLAQLDAQAFAPDVRGHPWRTIKGLILTGYYTSEIGAARELRFELTPGRFDPDLPLEPGDRAYSSDWTAVDFG